MQISDNTIFNTGGIFGIGLAFVEKFMAVGICPSTTNNKTIYHP